MAAEKFGAGEEWSQLLGTLVAKAGPEIQRLRIRAGGVVHSNGDLGLAFGCTPRGEWKIINCGMAVAHRQLLAELGLLRWENSASLYFGTLGEAVRACQLALGMDLVARPASSNHRISGMRLGLTRDREYWWLHSHKIPGESFSYAYEFSHCHRLEILLDIMAKVNLSHPDWYSCRRELQFAHGELTVAARFPTRASALEHLQNLHRRWMEAWESQLQPLGRLLGEEETSIAPAKGAGGSQMHQLIRAWA